MGNLLDADAGLSIEVLEGVEREIAALTQAIDHASPSKAAGLAELQRLEAQLRALRESCGERGSVEECRILQVLTAHLGDPKASTEPGSCCSRRGLHSRVGECGELPALSGR
jgi:hypothetical protein